MSQQSTGHKPNDDLYQPLDKSAYRIVHLLPGIFTDNIRCVLEIRQDLVMTSYEAVSYEWGDPAITKPISIAPMGSQMASRWPLLQDITEAFEKQLKGIQAYFMPLETPLLLSWCITTFFVWQNSTWIGDLKELLPCPWFIPKIVHTAGTSIILGIAVLALLSRILSFLIEITETKALIFLIDAAFSPSSPTQPVEFTTLEITTNLESALRCLRRQNRVRTLWIDALCIDQSNEHEKRSQIQLMDRIYSRANSTIVWLGGYHGHDEPRHCRDEQAGGCEQRRQIEEAFALIRYFSEWQFLYSWNLRRRFMVSKQGLIMLANRGWWERLWVIQEVSLSTGRVYIQCGHSLCGFEDFQSSWWGLTIVYPELRSSFKASIDMISTVQEFCYLSTYDQQSPSLRTVIKSRIYCPPRTHFMGVGFPSAYRAYCSTLLVVSNVEIPEIDCMLYWVSPEVSR